MCFHSRLKYTRLGVYTNIKLHIRTLHIAEMRRAKASARARERERQFLLLIAS